ncbi:MAG: hypothetical protein ACRERD_23320, partial [Candidatus Binatia bacterium]
MRIAEYRMWEERLRSGLLSFFFISLCLPIAIQQTALGLLLAFLTYEIVSKLLTGKSPKSKVQSPKSKVQSPKSKVQSPKSKVESSDSGLRIPHSALVPTPDPRPPTPLSLSSPLDRPLLLFLGALLFSTLWSPDVTNSLAGYRKLWLVGAFFVTYHLLRKPQEAQRLIYLMVGVAAVGAAYGIFQHFTGVDWARELLGKKPDLDPFWFGRQEGFRTKGLYPSGITYAHNLLFPLTFASVLFFSPGLSGRKRLVLAGSWGLMALALLFSLTRGVWIAYVVVLLLLGVLKGGKTLSGVSIGVVALSLLLLSAGEGVRQRFISIIDPAANIGRGFIWQANVD